MHELAIVQEVLAVVTEHSKGAKVTRVVLEIGKLSAVLPDAVRLCFDLCSQDTVAEGAQLEIHEPPGQARCRSCGAGVVLDKPFGRCSCGSTDLDWLTGDELKIKELEVA
jgi:hydrogenase nickel incorporation protein HypA/HybF